MNPGTRLEHYEIVDKLGEGGMGAVYRAHDTRLKRQVAVKVLPPMLAGDEQQLRRLEREAQLLAALNHPNVAAVYGLGSDDVVDEQGARRVTFLVMELVEGETLAERLAMGPLPWREAIDLGVGIAAGLEAAHERGIVHRDLKPANVQVCPDSSVKVLDFGLAKAFEGEGAATGSLDLSASPTLAAATRTGVILGTAAYMSPEQARGKPVDKRADVWAFGCVLYEMLAGRKAFGGETVSDILAAILKESPALEQLPPSTPLRLRLLLERCLQKNPAQRMRDIGDVRLELQATRDDPAPMATAASAPARPAWPIAAAAAGTTLIAGLLVGRLLGGNGAPPPEIHAILEPVASSTGLHAVAVSPDGLTVAEVRGNEAIQVRGISGLNWRDLPDTANASRLLFRRDGQRIYFRRRNELLSVGVDGSLPITEATFPEGSNAVLPFYDVDGNVMLTSTSSGKATLVRLSPQAGAQELWSGPSTALVSAHLGGDLYLAWDVGAVNIALFELASGEFTPLLEGYADPRHLGDGLVAAVDNRGRLALARLDRQTGAIVTAPSVHVEGLALSFGRVPSYDISASGTLAYAAGEVATDSGEALGWLARDGTVTIFSERRDAYNNDSRLSPDDRFVALEVGYSADTVAVWIHDIERDVRAPLAPGLPASFPVWSPDGREIILRIEARGDLPAGIYRVPVDRSAEPALLLEDPEGRFRLPMDWSPDGTLLAYVESDSDTRGSGNDIWLLPLEGGEPQPFLVTVAEESDPRFSPDGRRIAYYSSQSGRSEVYLRNVAGGGEIAVSGDGGFSPEWSGDGSELFFTWGSAIFSASIGAGDPPAVGTVRQVVQAPSGVGVAGWDVAADGQRFYVNPVEVGDETQRSLNAIFNWRREPPGGR